MQQQQDASGESVAVGRIVEVVELQGSDGAQVQTYYLTVDKDDSGLKKHLKPAGVNQFSIVFRILLFTELLMKIKKL